MNQSMYITTSDIHVALFVLHRLDQELFLFALPSRCIKYAVHAANTRAEQT